MSKCDEKNVFGLREYSRQDLFVDATDEVREADRFYIMVEADEVISGLKAENERLKRIKEKAFKLAEKDINTIANVELKLRAICRALCLLRAECARRNWCELYYEKKRDLRAFKNENPYITKQMEKYESIKQYWKAKAEEYK